MNRGARRMVLFETPGDYSAFEGILEEAFKEVPMRILEYTAMPNHWHFVLWPYEDGDLPRFMHRFTNKHAHRWATFHGVMGEGHVYGQRYRDVPVEADHHFYTVCRYVGRNPVRAGLVARPEQWRWSSLWRRQQADPDAVAFLADWPLPRPDDWLELVNVPLHPKDLEALRNAVRKGCPYGSPSWCDAAAKTLGLTNTLRGPGRPRKNPA